MPYILLFLLLILCTPTQAQQTIPLDGEWQFAIDRSRDGVRPKRYAEKIHLPGSMLTNGKGDPISIHTQWTGSLYDSSYYFNPRMEPYRHEGRMKIPFFLTPERHYVGNAWYCRKVTVPQEWKGRRVTLFLERPHIETTLWVNGSRVGHEMSLSVPHQYDITEYVKFGSDNQLEIQVYNGIENVCVGQDSHSVTDQTQGNWNGIAGNIELRATTPLYRKRVETDIATGTVRILLNDTIITRQIPTPVRLWSEHTPELYTIEVMYRGERIPVTFGFRDIHTEGRHIMLNGDEIWLRGTVENCCFPETGYPPTDVESWLRIFETCREYGLNHMRFHSYCPPEAAFIAADQVGIYLQPEGPSWPNHGVRLRRGMAIDQYLVDECKRIIDTYGSHPSFVMLAGGNEPAGDWVAWGKDFTREMRAYDSTRLYATASVGGGWAWDEGSDFHVKGGARGLEWDRSMPQSTDDYYDQVRQLAEVADMEIKSFKDMVDALQKRHDFFHENGCRLSDHGIEEFYDEPYTDSQIEIIFGKALRGQSLIENEIRQYKHCFLTVMAEMDHASDWAQQFHYGAIRDNNSLMYKQLGPDTGFDSIGEFTTARAMSNFLNHLNAEGKLTRTILYTLNPCANEVIATMLGNFQDGSCPGKIQFGSGWWFNDQLDGMTRQMNALSVLGLLSRFVGMLTDSRSFLSYPRHEYFRRLLCNLLGNDVERGLLPDDMESLSRMVEDISYNNAKNYFRF